MPLAQDSIDICETHRETVTKLHKKSHSQKKKVIDGDGKVKSLTEAQKAFSNCVGNLQCNLITCLNTFAASLGSPTPATPPPSCVDKLLIAFAQLKQAIKLKFI